jgi:hypothetical protein
MRLVYTLLFLIVKRFLRSPAVGKNSTIQIILGLIAIAVIGYFLVLGFALEPLIVNTLKQNNAVVFLNGLLVYYFITEFIIRFFIQSLPTITVQPLLHLPIKRGKLATFFLGLSLIQITNIFVFLLFSPFAFGVVSHQFGITQAWIWLLSLWSISLILHYAVVLIKLSDHKREIFIFISAICILIACSDYFDWIELYPVVEKFFNTILKGYEVIGALFLTLIFVHIVSYGTVLSRLYPKEQLVQELRFGGVGAFSFLENYGQTGRWLEVEFKMIFRNKRTREVLFMSTMFLFQELVLCYVMKEHDYVSFLFFGITCTGLFMGNYGQHTFSWQGDHFDFTLIQPTSLRLYVEAKYWILALVTGVWFLCTVPLVYFGWDILLINIAGTLYNIGVNTFIVMNMAMLDTTKLSLRNGGALNYEGAGVAQWLIGIPFLFAPLLIFAPFSLMGYNQVGVATVGLIGLTGIILHRKLMGITYDRFLDRRYKIAASFRK